MRPLVALLLALPLLAAGCNDPTAAPTSADADVAAEPGRMSEGISEGPVGPPWQVSGNVTLGWVAGVGADTWLGDFDVGLTSADVCPRWFVYLPPGTKSVHMDWDAPLAQSERPGAGSYQLVVSSDDHIWYILPLPGETGRDFEGPTDGIWELQVFSEPAAVNLVWEVQMTVHGQGPPLQKLEFAHDGDCA